MHRAALTEAKSPSIAHPPPWNIYWISLDNHGSLIDTQLLGYLSISNNIMYVECKTPVNRYLGYYFIFSAKWFYISFKFFYRTPIIQFTEIRKLDSQRHFRRILWYVRCLANRSVVSCFFLLVIILSVISQFVGRNPISQPFQANAEQIRFSWA